MNVNCLLPCCINQFINEFNQYLLSVCFMPAWRWWKGDEDPGTVLKKPKRETDIQTTWFQKSHGFRNLAETVGFRHCQLAGLGVDVMTCPCITCTLHKCIEEICYKDGVIFLFISRYCALFKQAWFIIWESLWRISWTDMIFHVCFSCLAGLLSSFLLISLPFILLFVLMPSVSFSLFFSFISQSFMYCLLNARYHFRHYFRDIAVNKRKYLFSWRLYSISRQEKIDEKTNKYTVWQLV